jgi:APA family basic amino acid/polyamine antiporter
VALITAAYAHHFLPDIDVRLLATAIIAVPATVHAVKVIAGARLNDAFVALKLVIMAVFIGAGLFIDIEPIAASAETAPPPPAPFSLAVGAAVISINFAFLGWSSVNTVAGEVRRPQRTLPLAILGAVAVVTTTYLLINIVFMRAIAPAAMVGADGEPMADIGAVVARMFFGEIGGDIVTLAIIAILLSTLTTMLFTGSRLFLAMAWKGELPAPLGRCNAAGAPSTSIAWYAGIAIVLLWLAPVKALLEYTGLLTTFCAALAGVTVLVLRRNVRDRPFSMPLHPLPACVFLGLSGWLLVSSAWVDPTVTLASIGTIACIVLLRPALTRNHTS